MARRKVNKPRKKTKKHNQIFYRNPEVNTKLIDIETIKAEGFDDIELNE